MKTTIETTIDRAKLSEQERRHITGYTTPLRHDVLYGVHILGPDDLIAAPSEAHAHALAVKLNQFFEKRRGEGEDEPILLARVIVWPDSRKDHARWLARDWPENAQYLARDSAPTMDEER